MIENIIVGIGTGLLSSLMVSLLFLYIARLDARKDRLTFLLCQARSTLYHVDPINKTAKNDAVHWLRCHEGVVRDEGFESAASGLHELSDDINSFGGEPIEHVSQERPGEAQKRDWLERLRSLG